MNKVARMLKKHGSPSVLHDGLICNHHQKEALSMLNRPKS